MKTFVGVDIGGTFTKVSLKKNFFRFETPKSEEELYNKVTETLCGLPYEIGGVGIAVAGAVTDGKARLLPNLGFSFDGREIERKLGVPVLTVNDGDAAAYGESRARDLSDMVLVTLGTGIGGGIVLGGKLYLGQGGAAEIGHMVICADGRKCGCGMNGCFEAYASGTALVKSYLLRAAKNVGAVDAKKVFELSDAGDGAAIEAVNEFYRYLSIGIINLCNIFRPKAIIIGGGVANRSDLTDRVKKSCAKLDYGYKFAPVPLILRAKMGENAGAAGAEMLIKNKVEEREE